MSAGAQLRNQETMKAIILAAGRGSRLEYLTDERPKPFVPVNGVPIILNALDRLADAGITEAIIAVGYMKEYFQEAIGTRRGRLAVSYVENDRWSETNNSYTLYLCRDRIASGEPLLLLEADIYFNGQFLNREVLADNATYWFCDAMFFTGSQIFVGDDGLATRVQIIRDPVELERVKQIQQTFKSAGTVKLAGSVTGLMFDRLGDFVASEENQKYYFDVYFNQVIADLQIRPYAVTPNSWYEIDTQEDLREAERTVRAD